MSQLNKPPRPSTAPGCQIIMVILTIALVILFMWLLNNARVNRPDQNPIIQEEQTVEVDTNDDYCTNCDKGQLLAHLDTLPMNKVEARENIVGRILEEDSENTKVRTMLIHTYMANGMTDEAETEYLTILDYQPKNIYVRQQLAKLYCKTEQLDKAQTLVDESASVMGNAGFMDLSAACVVERGPDRTVDGRENQ